MSNTIKTLQKYILAMGGKLPKYGVDGDFGTETKNAIIVLDIPDYVKTALLEVGTHEIEGIKNNPRVLEYHATTGKYSNDEVAWCGSFVAWVMIQNGIKPVEVGERAKSWLTFGKSISKPVVGAVAIKSRNGGGHVCIVVGENQNGDLLCVGGNQSNEVNIATYKKEVFEGFRVPDNFRAGKLPKVNLTTGTALSEA